jgi:hypothetical protein
MDYKIAVRELEELDRELGQEIPHQVANAKAGNVRLLASARDMLHTAVNLILQLDL